MLLIFEPKNDVRRAYLNEKKRISHWLPFWNKLLKSLLSDLKDSLAKFNRFKSLP